MPAKLLDGRALAAQVRAQVKIEIQKTGFTPGLAAVLIGADPASHVYVGLKEKAAAEVGIHFEKYLFFATEPQEKIIAKIRELNERPDIHAILVQLPLPPQFNTDTVIRAIHPTKDVDGFHPDNLMALAEEKPRVVPGVAEGIVALIASSGVPLQGKRAVLLVNSTTFALPIEYLLKAQGVFVETVVAPADLETVAPKIAGADILVTAIGRARAVTGDMIKHGVIIADVGTNRLTTGELVGDVDAQTANEKAGFITPVPGGVGPMTVAMLLKNTLELAKRACETA